MRKAPKYQGVSLLDKSNADNAFLRKAIFASSDKAKNQMKAYSEQFRRPTEEATCKAIFDFLKNEINYKADGEHQLIQLPSALLKRKTGDCKSYSVFTQAVLRNLGYDCFYVLTSYSSEPTPSHIYVQTKSGIIIDAVWGKFNEEKKPNYRYQINTDGTMRVQTIAGVSGCGCGCGGNCSEGVSGLFDFLKRSPEKKAAAEQRKEERKDKREERRDSRDTCGKQGLKPVTLSAGRNLFLIMVQSNLDGFATKMSKMNRQSLIKYWCDAGGNPYSLNNAIEKGMKRPSRRFGLLGRLANAAGIKINGISGTLTAQQKSKVKAAIPAAAAAAGAAIGVATGTTAASAGAGITFGQVLDAMLPSLLEMLTAMLPSDAGSNFSMPSDIDTSNDGSDNANPGPEKPKEKTVMGNATKYGLIALGLFVGYKIITKK